MTGWSFLQVPFWGPTEAAIFKQVQRGQLDLTRNPCKKLSRESKELMLSMLNRDPAVCLVMYSCRLCPRFLCPRVKLLIGMQLLAARVLAEPSACAPHSHKVDNEAIVACRLCGAA
jgi:hypothetical protein